MTRLSSVHNKMPTDYVLLGRMRLAFLILPLGSLVLHFQVLQIIMSEA